MSLPWDRMPRGPYLETLDFDRQLGPGCDGKLTEVLRGIICSCYDRETRQPDEHCTSCMGWGYEYDPARTLTIPVLWTSHAVAEHYERGGMVEPGTITATWQSEFVLGHGDLFVHPFEEGVETSELLTRGQLSPTGASMERLRFRHVTAIEVLRTMATVYEEGVDFNLGADGQTIEWLTDDPDPHGPEAGALYSVRYRYRAQYIIATDLPQQRHDDGVLLWHVRLNRFAPLSRQPEPSLGQT